MQRECIISPIYIQKSSTSYGIHWEISKEIKLNPGTCSYDNSINIILLKTEHHKIEVMQKRYKTDS